MWQMNTADTHLKTINWIFMWIIAGAGFRGTGRTGLENRSCMDYMPLPILFGQPVCMFPIATGYLVQEAYSLDFISATADSIGKNMQTLAGVTPSGLSTEGFYVGFLFTLDFGSWGLCCLYRTDKERNHKGNSCPHEFCAGFLSYRLPLLPMLPIILRKSMTFHQTSATLVCHWVQKLSCPIQIVKARTVWT